MFGIVIVWLLVNALFTFDLRFEKRPWFKKYVEGQGSGNAVSSSTGALPAASQLAAVAPAEGVALPIAWSDIGKKLVENGVIDMAKLEQVYASRGGIPEADKRLLTESRDGAVVMTPQNSSYLLNVLWALGLGNKNQILDAGPMRDPKYGGAGKFASTGGWSLAKGDAMEHYSKHRFIALTGEQQALVEKVSKNIFRPCCGNSTYFPDCNHGMAMLGLLELMASTGKSEEEMYRVALRVNAYWFPDTYETIARFLSAKGIAWKDADPKEILGAEYSSGAGFRKILSQVEPSAGGGGASCGV
mgnify:CR=1 FL=1